MVFNEHMAKINLVYHTIPSRTHYLTFQSTVKGRRDPPTAKSNTPLFAIYLDKLSSFQNSSLLRKKTIIQDYHLLEIGEVSRETTSKVAVLSWQKKKGRWFHVPVASVFLSSCVYMALSSVSDSFNSPFVALLPLFLSLSLSLVPSGWMLVSFFSKRSGG